MSGMLRIAVLAALVTAAPAMADGNVQFLGAQGQFGMRIGYGDGVVGGVEAWYHGESSSGLDDLAGYDAGLFVQWPAVPSLEIPLGGLFPGDVGLPESLPAELYLGGSLLVDIAEQNPYAALYTGIVFNPGEPLGVGLEYRHALDAEAVDGLADVADDDATFLTLIYRW